MSDSWSVYRIKGIKGILRIFETFNWKFSVNSDEWSVKCKGISGISGTFNFSYSLPVYTSDYRISVTSGFSGTFYFFS